MLKKLNIFCLSKNLSELKHSWSMSGVLVLVFVVRVFYQLKRGLSNRGSTNAQKSSLRSVSFWDFRALLQEKHLAVLLDGSLALIQFLIVLTKLKALDPLFLKNAVRSQLHFSQLNSWMINNGGKLPNGLVSVFRW